MPPPPPPGFAPLRPPPPPGFMPLTSGSATSAGPDGLQYIEGGPRQAPLHTQQTPGEVAIEAGHAAAAPFDAAKAAADAEHTRLENLALQQQQARGGLTAEQAAALRTQYESLAGLASGIDQVESLYRRDFRGRATTAFGYLPDGASPRNQAFNAAANRLMSAIASAQGLSAQQQNTPTELRIRFGPMLPQSTDTDETIEQKLGALRALLNQQRSTLTQQLGIPPPPPQPAMSAVPPAQGQGSVTPPGSGGPPSPDDGGLVVDVVGGHYPTSEADAGPDWRAAYQQARQRDPNLTFDQFVFASRAHGSGQAEAPEGDTLDRLISAGMLAGNPGLMAGQLLGAVGLHPGDMADAATRGVQDIQSFGTRDELAGVARTILGGGDRNANIARERGFDTRDWAEHPISRGAGELLGGFALPVNAEAGLGRNMLTTGAQGAAYGFGSGEGNFLQRAPGAAVGFGMGAAAPLAIAGGGRVINALRRAAPEVAPEAQALAQAGAAENVPLSRPLVDPAARDRMMYLESSPGSGDLIRQPLENTRAAIEERSGRLGAGGVAQEPGTMGDIIQNAGRRELNQQRTSLQKGYDRAGQMAAGAPIYGRELVAELDDQIATLSRNPSRNRALINFLNTQRADFVDDAGNLIPKTIEDIRDARTGLSGEINRRNMTHTPAERLVSRALDRARVDIKRDLHDIASLDPTSPESIARRGAWDLYRRTDIGWGQRARFQRQVLDRIIGPADNPKVGSQVMAQVRALAAGENPGEDARLTRLWGAMNQQERLDTAATIASTFGRAAPDEPFSPATFIRSTRSIQPSARSLMFGPEGAQTIANLRVLSQALKDTAGRINNTRSGAAVNWAQFFRELGGGSLPGAVVGATQGGLTGAAIGSAAVAAATTGIGLIARRMSARSLMSPDMSRWLATGVRLTTPQQIQKHIGRLSAVATRDPAIAQEVLGLRQALLNAVNDNAPAISRSAASSGGGANADTNQQ